MHWAATNTLTSNTPFCVKQDWPLKLWGCWVLPQLWRQQRQKEKKEGGRFRKNKDKRKRILNAALSSVSISERNQSHYSFTSTALHLPCSLNVCIVCVCVFGRKTPHTTLHIQADFMVRSRSSQATHLCRTRGHAWKMIIGRNERRGTWRLSHLQENAENDVQEFSREQGCPLLGCFCCMSGWLLFGTSSHSNDVPL